MLLDFVCVLFIDIHLKNRIHITFYKLLLALNRLWVFFHVNTYILIWNFCIVFHFLNLPQLGTSNFYNSVAMICMCMCMHHWECIQFFFSWICLRMKLFDYLEFTDFLYSGIAQIPHNTCSIYTYQAHLWELPFCLHLAKFNIVNFTNWIVFIFLSWLCSEHLFIENSAVFTVNYSKKILPFFFLNEIFIFFL